MIFNLKNKNKKCLRLLSKSGEGFTIVEVLVSVGIISIVLLAIISFVLWMNYYNAKTRADREASENARRALSILVHEIREAKSIYAPTTTSSQLSLETTKYLPTGENYSFIDFFICDSALCMKKESNNPLLLTSDSVEVSSLQFSQILNGNTPSIQIDLTISYKNPNSASGNYSSASLTSTARLRSY